VRTTENKCKPLEKEYPNHELAGSRAAAACDAEGVRIEKSVWFFAGREGRRRVSRRQGCAAFSRQVLPWRFSCRPGRSGRRGV